MTACRSSGGTCSRTPATTWYLTVAPPLDTPMIRCRSSGSPLASGVSAMITRSTAALPPGYQRWAGSHVASEFSNVMIAGMCSFPSAV